VDDEAVWKAGTPDSLKALKSRTGDINFSEDLSVIAEKFS